MSDPEASEHEHDDVTVQVADFANQGAEVVDTVPVQLSYGIIERFSEGLYSSPNKAFEELVTNSYDAGAERVWVYLPADLSDSTATLVVVDDGQSMDLAGLHDLWRIGESRKRSDSPPPGRSKPVGKFGIGKLATYVLAENLTYVAHRDSDYFAVTMDYSKLAGSSSELLDAVTMTLDVVRLSRDQALTACADALMPFGGAAKALTFLQGSPEPEHWTVAVMARLKPAAQAIRLGRLRWVLRTALPLSPAFILHYNDDLLESSKLEQEKIWTFVIGKDEAMLEAAKQGSSKHPWHTARPPSSSVKTTQRSQPSTCLSQGACLARRICSGTVSSWARAKRTAGATASSFVSSDV